MTGVSEQDARALTYLATRIRQETYGAGVWDEHGIFVNVMKRAGQNVALVAQDVIGHAARPDAKTPGVIASSMRGPTVEPQKLTATPPTRDESCKTCGRHLDRHPSDHEPTTRVQRADTATQAAALAELRTQIRTPRKDTA